MNPFSTDFGRVNAGYQWNQPFSYGRDWNQPFSYGGDWNQPFSYGRDWNQPFSYGRDWNQPSYGSFSSFMDPRTTFQSRFGQYDVPFSSPFTPSTNMWSGSMNTVGNLSMPMFPSSIGFGMPAFPFMDFQSTQGGATPLLGREIDQMLWKKGNIANKLWVPRTNILDEGDNLRVEVELPGVKIDDVRVALMRNVLVISPAKPIPQFPVEKGLPLQHESHFGYFYRQLLIPESVDSKKISAEFEDGILRIIVPKSSDDGQKININKK